MPFNKANYPDDWKAISLRIRERDGWKCKWCGVPNGAWVLRDADGGIEKSWNAGWRDPSDGHILVWHEDDEGEICSDTDAYAPNEPHPIRIVLTVAHYPDPDPMNCADDNLQSLCQRCHNRIDSPMRVQHAAETRRMKRLNGHRAAGQMEIEL